MSTDLYSQIFAALLLCINEFDYRTPFLGLSGYLLRSETPSHVLIVFHCMFIYSPDGRSRSM